MSTRSLPTNGTESQPRQLTKRSQSVRSKKVKKKKKLKKKSLSFAGVHVREYNTTLGETVCGSGAAIGLGWKVVGEKKYKSLEEHERTFFSKYRRRGKMGEIPPRVDKIIEWASDKNDFWVPPRQRYDYLLTSGIDRQLVHRSMRALEIIRNSRELSCGDRDALCYTIAVHRNISEEAAWKVLTTKPPPPSGPPPSKKPGNKGKEAKSKPEGQSAADNDDKNESKENRPKTKVGMSIRIVAKISCRMRAHLEKAKKAVALRKRLRRSSIIGVQVRGMAQDEMPKTLEMDLHSTEVAGGKTLSPYASAAQFVAEDGKELWHDSLEQGKTNFFSISQNFTDCALLTSAVLRY